MRYPRTKIQNRQSKIVNREAGQSLTAFMLIAALGMLLIIGLLYDAGAVAVAQVRAQDAADLAVQEAAKQLDMRGFYGSQQIRLAADAPAVAQQYLAQAYPEGNLTLTGLYVTRPDSRHWAITLTARVAIPMRFLRMIGIRRIERNIRTVGVATFGANQEGQ